MTTLWYQERRNETMFFTCKDCNYTFKSAEKPERCPDCGRFAVRDATDAEIEQYKQYRLEFDQEEEANKDEDNKTEGNRASNNGDARSRV